ncbi:hypothetical protein A2U01_0111170, partial [Trifolium medium]|nr:hypothetical protein [Trifolium medium]
ELKSCARAKRKKKELEQEGREELGIIIA